MTRSCVSQVVVLVLLLFLLLLLTLNGQNAIGDLYFDVLLVHSWQFCPDFVSLVCLGTSPWVLLPNPLTSPKRRDIEQRARER